jgi:hypothetical protein
MTEINTHFSKEPADVSYAKHLVTNSCTHATGFHTRSATTVRVQNETKQNTDKQLQAKHIAHIASVNLVLLMSSVLYIIRTSQNYSHLWLPNTANIYEHHNNREKFGFFILIHKALNLL